MKRVEKKAAEISEDIDDLRDGIRSQVERVSHITTAFSAAGVARRVVGFFKARRQNAEEEYEEVLEEEVSDSEEK